MSKCLGCGATLQNESVIDVGYVKDIDSKLCERCFRIKNYGEYKPVIKENEEFVKMLDLINNSKDLVVLVCDLFNFNPNMELFNKLNNDVLLVLTKRDLLPKSLYEDKLLNYLKHTKLNIIDRVVISSINNYNFDNLLDKIKDNQKSNNVYVVGFTNAGKSTMINKMLHNYSKEDIVITTSLLPNTTIDKIDIKLDDELTLIDTPGILDNGSIYYLKDLKDLKRIIPKKAIKPRTFQIKSNQSVLIEDLVRLDASNNNVTIFVANNLNIERKYKIIDTDLEKHEIEVNANEDVVISGLGFIKFTKKEKINVYTLKGVSVYKRKSLI